MDLPVLHRFSLYREWIIDTARKLNSPDIGRLSGCNRLFKAGATGKDAICVRSGWSFN